jgi:protein SCO1/2
MPEMNRRDWLGMLGASRDGAPAKAQGQNAKWANISPRENVRNRYFPNIVLTTHENRKVRLYEDMIKDKIVVINYFYATCEGICPTITRKIARVQKTLGDRVGRDIFFYSFTLKPKQDTPGVLNHHAKMHGIGNGWQLITGDPHEMEALRFKLGFYDPDPVLDRDTTNHAGALRYGNEPMSRWATCSGFSPVDWIIKSILWVDWPENQKPQVGTLQTSRVK